MTPVRKTSRFLRERLSKQRSLAASEALSFERKAACFAAIADTDDVCLRANAEQATDYFNTLKLFSVRRLQCYNERRILARMGLFLKLWFNGAYKEKHKGGFGAAGLLKDALISMGLA